LAFLIRLCRRKTIPLRLLDLSTYEQLKYSFYTGELTSRYDEETIPLEHSIVSDDLEEEMLFENDYTDVNEHCESSCRRVYQFSFSATRIFSLGMSY
jgi:hypothetical protein